MSYFSAYSQINGRLIGKERIEVLTSSPEISLGRPTDVGDEDLRFIFRPPSQPKVCDVPSVLGNAIRFLTL